MEILYTVLFSANLNLILLLQYKTIDLSINYQLKLL